MTEEDTFNALKKWSYETLLSHWQDTTIEIPEFFIILKKAGWTWDEFSRNTSIKPFV